MQAKEAPGLTLLVKAGKLPPLAQRLPLNPLVVPCYEQPGFYGGTWKMMVDNPDLGMYKMIAGYAPMMRWKADCSGLEPGTAERWEYNSDGTQLTVHLRHGIKWSDGVEFTSEDYGYWAQLTAEKNQLLTRPVWSLTQGKDMVVETPDKYTIVMKFAGPNWFVPLNMATGFWNSDDYNMPKHYLKQFDPHINPRYKNYTVFDKKNSSHFNPDRPTLWPWKLKEIAEGGFKMEFERNPYYYMVDTLGRQLPYIDRIICSYVPDAQVRVLKLLSGEIDAQFRLVDLQDYGLYMDGRQRGGYRIIKWDEATGGESSLLVNWSVPDPVLRDLFRTFKFRAALSLAIDRNKCNDVAWRGLAIPQQATISRESWHFHTPEGKRVFDAWAKSYAEYDIPHANRLLDEIGLTRRDSDGFRLRKDGNRLSILIDVPPQKDSGTEADESLITADGWKKLGIDAIVKNWPSAEYSLRQKLGKFQVSMFGEAEMDLFTYPDWVFPTGELYWHSEIGRWYKSKGAKGEAPVGVMKDLLDIYAQILTEKDIERAHILVQKAIELHTAQGLFAIGTAANPPILVIVKNSFRNVPVEPRIMGPWAPAGPATSYPETFFFAPQGWKAPGRGEGAIGRLGEAGDLASPVNAARRVVIQ
jgi:peptide/nickel transport system substrate-binding protein